MKKFIYFLVLTMLLCTLTGCGKDKELPIQGVSINGAQGKTSGFTYIYDFGDGYKLYCDNLTMIVYLVKDFSDGRGATSVGSSSICPYISPNGYYYKIDVKTRVISEVIPQDVHIIDSNPQTSTDNKTPSSTPSNQDDIEAILNQNSQKNQETKTETTTPTEESKQDTKQENKQDSK